MSEAWQSQDERGSSALVRLIVWIALNVGYSAGRMLLYPICLYFLTFSVSARRASRDYLRRVLGRTPGFADQFRHYFCFASTILDRPFFLAGRFQLYDIRIHGLPILEAMHETGPGGILMGAHIGSFEVMRCLATTAGWLDLKIMMYADKSQRINRIFDEINPDYAKNVIALGKPNSVIQAYDCITAGGVIGILADRNTKGGKCVTVPFLGQDADFPLGPAMLAGAAKCPVVVAFTIYRGARSYDIYFEQLRTRVPHDYRTNPAALSAMMAEFAQLMEAHCRDAPYNWFNFFDFWKGNEK